MTAEIQPILITVFGTAITLGVLVIGFFLRFTLSTVTTALIGLQEETKAITSSINADRTENKIVGARVISLDAMFRSIEERLLQIEQQVDVRHRRRSR